MDNRNEVREFLSSRRAKLTPQQAGLPAYGGHRRVPGLRREEVSMLAGLSVDYYTRLERGNLSGASESVLESLAQALQLDDAERAHLFHLARTANAGPRTRSRRAAAQAVRPGVQRVLDAMGTAPAWVRNGRADIVASNRLGRALYAPVFDDPVRPANTARFAFLNRRATEFYRDWEQTANDMVGVLRAEAGRNPYDRDLDLTYEAMELSSEPGLTLLVYTAEPASATQDGLSLLASWAATLDQVDGGAAPDHDQSARGDHATGDA